MKTIWIILLFLIPCLATAQSGSKAQQAKLQGIWVTSDAGFQMTMQLNSDGTGELDREPIKYSAEGNKLTVTADGEVNVYTFRLDGNTLTVSDGDLDKPMKFTRQATTKTSAKKTNEP